jgi:hypothetical protein
MNNSVCFVDATRAIHARVGRVDRKSDLRKNVVGLNLTPESVLTGEIWHPNPNPSGFINIFLSRFSSDFYRGFSEFFRSFQIFFQVLSAPTGEK